MWADPAAQEGLRRRSRILRRNAGDDYETPVLEPRALELLARYGERAFHYETATDELRH
jgi:hypothetical protein